MRPPSQRPRYRPPVPAGARDLAAMPPAAHETTLATQQDAIESESYADAVNRPVAGAIARNTLIVAGAFVGSRLLGFLREILIAQRFGTSGEADAYAAAFRVPDVLFLVVMSAAFGSAFIPVFAGYLTRGDDDRAWDLANAVLTWTIGITIVVGALIFAFADPIIRYLITPDLDESSIRLAADLMRVLVLSPLLLGIGIAAKGILEAQDRFLMPALAPLVYNLGIIIGVVGLAPSYGIRGVALGVIIGAAGHAAIQLPSALRSGLRFRPTLDRRVEGLGEVARLLGPRVVGQVAFAANFIVITNVASRLGEGGPSSINYAWQLLMLPHGVLALSVSTVIFPAMARQWEQRDVAALSRTFEEAIRPLIFFSVPVALILFLYREPIVATLLQRGDFTRASTVAVAAPLAALAAALVAYALVEVLTRAFYAMKDARTPVVVGLVVVALNVAIALLTIDRFGGLALGLALGVSTTVEAIVLAAILFSRLSALGVPSSGTWGWWLTRLAVAGGIAAMFGVLAADPLRQLFAVGGSSFVVRTALVVIAVGLVAVPFGLLAWGLALPEMAMLERRATRLLRPLARRLPASLRAELGISRGIAFDRRPISFDEQPAGAAGAAPPYDPDRDSDWGGDDEPGDYGSRAGRRRPGRRRPEPARPRGWDDRGEPFRFEGGDDRPGEDDDDTWDEPAPARRPVARYPERQRYDRDADDGRYGTTSADRYDDDGEDDHAAWRPPARRGPAERSWLSGEPSADDYGAPRRRPGRDASSSDPYDDQPDPYDPLRDRGDGDGYREAAGTGRFGNRPPLPRRRPPDEFDDEPPAPERRPFRSTQQTRLPDWYTPTRRNRRSESANDYTEGSNGRSSGPRQDL